jgi:protein arginine kinase activator
LTDVSGGKATERHLCESCAAKVGVMGYEQAQKVADLFEQFDVNRTVGPEDRCPRCGTTMKRIQNTGRIGCAYDYEFFRKDLQKLLEHVQHGTQHRGKIPQGFSSNVAWRQQVQSMREEMQEAILREEYERAAQLRDALKELEEQRDETV